MKYLLYILLAVLFIGCIEDDTPVEPYDRGDVETNIVGMGKNYTNQLYFDLGTNSIVGENDHTIWNLGFDCSEGEMNIILNTANFSKAINVGVAYFDEDIPYEDSLMRFDSPKGYLDSTAIDKWWEEKDGEIVSKGEMYIIDLGLDEKSLPLGFRKFKVLDYNDTSYVVSYSKMDGSNVQTVEVVKDPTKNFIFLSFTTNEVLNLEPPKLSWDLFFSRHTAMLSLNDGTDDYLEYSVSSVLLNQKYVSAASFRTEMPFDQITNAVIDTLQFSNARDAVGHEWKYYDFDQGYLVFSDIIYIIKDTEGFYYKFHFIDFYNDDGEKGYPEFEFQKI